MNNTIKVCSKGAIGSEEIELVNWAIRTYPFLSRYELIVMIAEWLEWTNDAGRPKVEYCDKICTELEQMGVIQLPEKQAYRVKKSKKEHPQHAMQSTQQALQVHELIERPLNALGEIRLVKAVARKTMPEWRAYIQQYHMIGDGGIFGSRLYYFIVAGEEKLGCMSFSASSWAMEAREQWIGWDSQTKQANLHLVINNSRFLIFPWVRVKYLASKVLSVAARQVPADWLRIYCYEPVLMETFVDVSQYEGTSYKAANWYNIGMTKGRGRMDRHSKQALSQKAIYMYPLRRDFRAILRGEKPYRRGSADDL